ncbi:hypothetical protein IW138_000166 [Coemansia sp. RSA 986]|nr:hypothetical protein IW138_000166 [Coemansia sp. RSA 986]
MPKLQLSSLDEFIASLSKQDYEAAKIASGKVMEDHIQMGALMFSLLTIEMMYTSMDYLTPGNFQRGNGYMLSMYNGLPRRLRRLHKRLVLEYQEEHQRLVASFVHPMQSDPTARTDPGKQNHSSRSASRLSGRPNNTASAFQPVNSEGGGSSSGGWRLSARDVRPNSDNHKSAISQHSKASAPDSFDPKHYLGSLERAEKVLEDLEALSLFVEFIIKFIDVRKTMVVLYRFVAVTSPVLYVQKLDIMLKRCKRLIESIQPSHHYQTLLDSVRSEVWLVRNIVDWDSQILAYNFVKAVTTMQNTRGLLKSWQEAFPECAGTRTSAEAIEAARAHSKAVADALGSAHNTNDGGLSEGAGDSFAMQQHNASSRGSARSSSQGLLYMAFTKSSQLVQNLFWGGGNTSSADENHESGHARIHGVVKLLDCWVSFLSFKTTAYFQQIIASYRSLYYDDMAAQAKRTAVINDIWSRPELSKTDLGETLHKFMTSNDACFVTLLFESSKQHPFTADGFALRGTKISVSDYRVQACAILFCITNESLMVARGRSLKESIVHDVYSINSGPPQRAAGNVALQSDVEWFRQNCLPDILYILDGDRETLDYELLGSSPLVDRLGANADELLVELGDLVHEVVGEATEPVHSAQESAGDTLSSMEHDIYHAEYPSDDAASAKPNENSNVHVHNPQYLGYEQHNQQPLEAPHHGAHSSTVGSDHAVGLGEDHHDNPNLYSTYLLKSHLRNNLQHEEQLYSGRGNRRFAGRHSSQAMRNKQGQARVTGDTVERIGPQNNRDSGKHNSRDHTLTQQTTGYTGPVESAKSAQANIKGSQKQGGGIQRLRNSAADLSLSHAAVASSGNSAKRRVASTSRVSGIGKGSGSESSLPDQISPTSYMRDTSGRHRVASIQAIGSQPQQAMRKNANTISTPSPGRRRAAQSIRSLFNPSLLLGMGSHQTSPQEQIPAEESAVEKRVRRGMRLRELFGSWNMRGGDAPEDTSALFLGNGRRGSIHSFSFSTPTRASVGPRPAGVTAAALDAATSQADEAGGGLAYRLSRAAAASSISMESDAPRRTGEVESMSTLDQLRRFNQLLPQQILRVPHAKQQQQQQPPPPLHSGHSSSDAVAGVTSETYTYLYARVGLPNVVMVAALLDTERGLACRSDTQREWDKIVDKLRGMTLFEQMMTVAG